MYDLFSKSIGINLWEIFEKEKVGEKEDDDELCGFLDDYGKNIILDEIQRMPSLFSYLQEWVCFFSLTQKNDFLGVFMSAASNS